jgi:hypothetical protein
VKLHPGLEILSEKVPCASVMGLLDKHRIDRLDLFHVDTEGYDFEVLKLIDFKRVKPRMILFEHIHLSADDRAACAAMLTREGYTLKPEQNDTLATLA